MASACWLLRTMELVFRFWKNLLILGYPNLYYSIKGTHEFVDSHQGETNSRALPGFTTSTKTRPLIVAKLEEFIRNKLITLYSSRFFHELKTFIWHNGKPQAMRSYHDDLIMSLAIACWVRDTALQTNQRDVEYKKAMLGWNVHENNKNEHNNQRHGRTQKTFEEKCKKRNKTSKRLCLDF